MGGFCLFLQRFFFFFCFGGSCFICKRKHERRKMMMEDEVMRQTCLVRRIRVIEKMNSSFAKSVGVWIVDKA